MASYCLRSLHHQQCSSISLRCLQRIACHVEGSYGQYNGNDPYAGGYHMQPHPPAQGRSSYTGQAQHWQQDGSDYYASNRGRAPLHQVSLHSNQEQTCKTCLTEDHGGMLYVKLCLAASTTSCYFYCFVCVCFQASSRHRMAGKLDLCAGSCSTRQCTAITIWSEADLSESEAIV